VSDRISALTASYSRGSRVEISTPGSAILMSLKTHDRIDLKLYHDRFLPHPYQSCGTAPIPHAITRLQTDSVCIAAGSRPTHAAFHSTVKPRFTNNSVYEQIFRTQSVSDDVLCLELRTFKPSTSWSDKLGVSASAVFVEE
jgi:hypothetical protein